MSKLTAKVFYMRDNHTFRELDINDIDDSLAMIAYEYASGFTAGMLCSKHERAPKPIHVVDDLLGFLFSANLWLGKFKSILEKESATCIFEVDNHDIRKEVA